MLFVIGVALWFIANWIWGVVAILVYWFVLPLIVTPIVKRYMLPPWEEVKDYFDLEKDGYTKNNYRNGDWWKD